MAYFKEWNLKRAKKEWVPQTRPVQHVGVPGYQWQTAVMWDGSLCFGPFGFRKIEEFPGARIASKCTYIPLPSHAEY